MGGSSISRFLFQICPQHDGGFDSRSILIKIINMKNLHESAYCTVESGEACDRLGVSRDTLYAYVSRGLVRTVAHPADARKSLYDRRDIEALFERKRHGRSRRAVAESTINWGEPVLVSKITRIADGRFSYRRRDAVEFSRKATLEQALGLLAGVRVKQNTRLPEPFRPVTGALPFDRIVTMMAGQAVAGSGGDGRPRAALLLRLTAVCAAGRSGDTSLPIHDLLAAAWSADPALPDLVRRALVLCADHELNASTYAARVAASAGASLPAALLAGLATLSGTRHGGVTVRCHRWMDRVERHGLPPLAPDTPPPGFGHPLYPDGDPRAAELLRHCPLNDRWHDIVRLVREVTGTRPALDFALARIERRHRLPDGAALGLFAVGRTAGWIAHIFEQRHTGRLIRPRASG
jgi:citrate synthase